MHVIQLNVFFGVFIIRSVVKAGHSGKPSRLLGCTMVEGRSVRPNRYFDAHNIMVMFHVNLWIVLHCGQIFELQMVRA